MRTLLIALCGLVLYATAARVQAADLTVGPESDTACLYHDLQEAVSAVHGNVATVRVSNGFTSPPIHHEDRIVHIIGGYQSCAGTDLANAPLSFIDGSLDSAEKPLIKIDGSAKLDLQNFGLSGGHNRGGNGGGIAFVSNGDHGHIELHNVTIVINNADKGAGIFFNGGSAADDLQLFHTTILSNFANNAGGGIRLQGHVHMDMSADSVIAGNEADRNDGDSHGGGLQVLDGSVANINGIIGNNTAKFGAGVAMHDNAVLRLVSGANGLASVSDNESPAGLGGLGGGLWLSGTTNVCGVGYAIDRNKAPDGAAIFVEQNGPDTYTMLSKGDSPIANPDFLLPCAAFGSVTDQSTINGNQATAANGAIVTVDHGRFVADGVEMKQNIAANLFTKTFTTDDSYITLGSCLLAHNSSDNVLIESHAMLRIDGCTIADNTVHQPQIMTLEGIASIVSSVVYQPGSITLHAVGGGFSASLRNMLVSDPSIGAEATTYLAFDNVLNGDPLFVDPSGSNYNVMANSPVIDSYAGCGVTSDGIADLQANKFDRPGNLRGRVVSGAATPCDMGAFEYQGDAAPPPMDDTIFENGFDPRP